VVKALDASPYADNTLIVLWSDHGYHLGEKGRFAKQAIWERATRVPLIIAGPGLEKGQRSSKPVSLLDLYPTLLDLCDLPANPGNDGNSVAPLLANPSAEWEHPVVIAYGPVNFAIRDERFRSLHYEDGSAELYDLRNDPNEWTNLAGKPEFESVLADHRSRIHRDPAPMAAGSSYDINPYFQARLSKWRE
jgi:arylsulfatase A-like enzyme